MWRWVMQTVLVGVVAVAAYEGYNVYRSGYFTRPEMPEGAFSVSYASGLRGIMIGIPNERDKRQYLGFPMQVPAYLKEAWTTCTRPTAEDAPHLEEWSKTYKLPGDRIEAVCKITVGRDVVVRGVIQSVPKV